MSNSCATNGEIVKTYIIDDSPGLSGCTLEVDEIISCSSSGITIQDNVFINGFIVAPIFSGGTYYGDGSNLSGISTDNFYVTGGTYSNGTLILDRQNGLVTITGFTDVYTTGVTFNNNQLLFTRNDGLTYSEYLNTFTGLTISNLSVGQVVYVGSDGKLKTDNIGEFSYNDSINTLTIGTTSGKLVVNNGLSDGFSSFGQGGLVIGSGGSHNSPGIGDLIVHGNFIVFGTGTTVATNELYVEDSQITLNYNPTGDTSSTSISSGFRIQSGNGTPTGDTYFTISQLNTLTGLTSTEIPDVTEYTGSIGYENRGWLTQLNDIVIRNNNINNGAPNGVRVLTEFDTLDGGTY